MVERIQKVHVPGPNGRPVEVPHPYDALGVPSKASKDEIKTAYRRRAKELHPDRNPGNPQAGEAFRDISMAYELLANKDLRRLVDVSGIPPAQADMNEASSSDPFAQEDMSWQGTRRFSRDSYPFQESTYGGSDIFPTGRPEKTVHFFNKTGEAVYEPGVTIEAEVYPPASEKVRTEARKSLLREVFNEKGKLSKVLDEARRLDKESGGVEVTVTDFGPETNIAVSLNWGREEVGRGEETWRWSRVRLTPAVDRDGNSMTGVFVEGTDWNSTIVPWNADQTECSRVIEDAVGGSVPRKRAKSQFRLDRREVIWKNGKVTRKGKRILLDTQEEVSSLQNIDNKNILKRVMSRLTKMYSK